MELPTFTGSANLSMISWISGDPLPLVLSDFVQAVATMVSVS
jgi:hypothetical protein